MRGDSPGSRCPGPHEKIDTPPALLDRYRAEIGRDPASVTRSCVVPVSYDQPGETRDSVERFLAAGFRHVVLSLRAPYPDGVAGWVAREIIARSA